MSAMKWAGSFQFLPEVHMFVWRPRHGRASVKRAEMDNPNEGLTTIFRSLQLVERLLFMTESAHFVFLVLFSRLRAMNVYSHRR